MEFVVVRHGETLWNKENIFTGWTDIDLSVHGRQEAYHSAQILKVHGIDIDLVYTSVLKRSIHTALIMMDEMDRAWVPLIKDYRLNERHYGALQGFNKEEAAYSMGIENVYSWRRTYRGRPPLLAVNDARAPRFQPQYRYLEPELLPLGESIYDTQQRVKEVWLDDILPEISKGKRVLLVMHANSMRAFMQELSPMSYEELETLFIPTGFPILFDYNLDTKQVSWQILGDQKVIEAKIDGMKSKVIKD